LKVLGAVEGKGVKQLTQKLSDLMSEEYLLSLMNQTARPLPYQTLCLARLVVLQPLSERAFEEAFSCFTEQLSQVSLSPGVIELAEEVSERLSSSRLGQLNSVLERQPRDKEVDDKLGSLRLKEANLLLREGDVEIAVSVVSSLHSSQHLDEEVLKFYEEAGLLRGKVKMLKHKLSTSVEALSQESPSVAATIRILSQLLDTELLSLRTEEFPQESFADLRAEISALQIALAKAGSDAKQVEAAQHLQVLSLEKQFQESLVDLKAIFHEVITKERNEIQQENAAQFAEVQRFIEQSKKTEAATHKSIDCLRAEVGVVHEAVAMAGNESATQMQPLEGPSERKESAYQERLVSLTGELETLKRELAEPLRFLKFDGRYADFLVAQSELQMMEQDDLDTHTTSFYSYKQTTDQLYETSLVDGEESCHRIPSYTFKKNCCWSELPGWSLFITGGGDPVTSEVVKIDTRTWTVSEQPPMFTARRAHAAVYHAQYLYVLGGYTGSSILSECERFVCAESRWEALPPLPTACCSMSGVVMERSLYALGGGINSDPLDLIQKLSLEGLTWEPQPLNLPQPGRCIPCFKLSDTEVYFVLDKTLYSLQTLRPVKTLAEGALSGFGPSHYSRGSLYCSTSGGAARRLEIGSLN
jgi:hypothetical protein